MKRRMTVILSALLIGWNAFPSTGHAQALCGAHGDIATSLKNGYSETPISMGLANNGVVVEVFASKAGTFTIIMTRPNGLSCMVAAGDNWEDLPERMSDAKI